jgi:hypothetical protein
MPRAVTRTRALATDAGRPATMRAPSRSKWSTPSGSMAIRARSVGRAKCRSKRASRRSWYG